MNDHDIQLLAELHALPETDPVDSAGEQFATCACVGLLTLLNTICVGSTW
ncbi:MULTISPECIES: VenA family class IV lanthipeptide [Streptomyces]|nr:MULTISPECIES: VenA family class IV lanthipeptide [Streptomyces]